MSLTLALNTAISGLSLAQQGLDNVSHNIANVNTEGFTRKIFEPESRVLNGFGAGSQLASISRRVDQNLLEDLRGELGGFGNLDSQNNFYARLQDVFGTPASNSSVSHFLNELNEEFETLATEPQNATTHVTAVSAGVRAADQIQRMSDTIQGLRLDADREMQRLANDASDQLRVIASLNEQISLGNNTTVGTTDLEDKRDVALNRLAEIIDIQYFARENNEVTIFTNDGTVLLDSNPVTISHAAVPQANATQTFAGGDFNGIFAGMRDITNTIQDGRLKGMVDLRDNILPDIQAQLDELSEQLMNQVNAIHNKGTAFPALQSTYTGTRTFIDGTETVDFTGGDVALVLYDSTGNEVESAKLLNDIGFTSPGTVNQLATDIQTYLTGLGGLTAGATVALNADNQLEIDLGTTNLGLAFRDETGAAKGSDQDNITVDIDYNSDGTDDAQFTGFANFFGLNDFFVTNPPLNQWQTEVKATNFTTVNTGAVTLEFSDETNGFTYDTITVPAQSSLSEIADLINNDAGLSATIEAEVIPEGSGERLRLKHILGEQIYVTQAGGTSVIDDLGIRQSEATFSNALDVRADLKLSPNLVSRGQAQFNNDTGLYFLSAGDNEVALELASVMTSAVSFDDAGGLTGVFQTFSEFGSSILSNSSSLAAAVETDFTLQQDLKEALEVKAGEISGVNLDEELSQLLVFEQSYAAAARVISTTQQLFDILNNL